MLQFIRSLTKTRFSILLLINTVWQISCISTAIFISTYIFKLTGDLNSVCTYYLGLFLAVTLTMIFIAPSSKAGKNIFYIRLAIWIQFIFFALLLFLKTDAVYYILPLGMLLGVSWGFYFLPYTELVLDIKSSSRRTKFLSYEKCLVKTISIISPILIGASITIFDTYAAYFLFLGLSCLVTSYFSTFLKQTAPHKTRSPYDFSAMTEMIIKNKDIAKIMFSNILSGVCSPIGILTTLVIYMQLGSELNLGIFTSLMPISAIFTAFAVSRMNKDKHGETIVLSALFLVLLLSSLNLITFTWQILLILFLYNSILPVYNIIHGSFVLNIRENHPEISDYSTEYLLYREIALFVGRAISFLSVIGIYSYLQTESVWGLMLCLLSLSFVVAAYSISNIKINEPEQSALEELQAA